MIDVVYNLCFVLLWFNTAFAGPKPGCENVEGGAVTFFVLFALHIVCITFFVLFALHTICITFFMVTVLVEIVDLHIMYSM